MEAPGIAWVALVLGAILLGGGLALLKAPPTETEVAPACDVQAAYCPQTSAEALREGTGTLLAWAVLGMAMLMDVLFLGLTRGGTVLT